MAATDHAPTFFAQLSHLPHLRMFLTSSRTACYATLIGWLTYIIQQHNFTENYRLIKIDPVNEHPFQAACFEWITMPRNRSQLETIIYASCTCPNDSVTRLDMFHALGATLLEGDQPGTCRSLSAWRAFIMQCFKPLIEVYPSMAERPLNVHLPLGLSKTWPRSFDEMFPHGIETTTRTMNAWLSCTGEFSIGEAPTLIGAIESWRLQTMPLTRPWIMNSPSLAYNLRRIMSFFVDSIMFGKQPLAHPVARARDAGFSKIILGLRGMLLGCSEPDQRSFLAHCPGEYLACLDQCLLCCDRLISSLSKDPQLDSEGRQFLQQYKNAKQATATVGGTLYDLFPGICESIVVSSESRKEFLKHTVQGQETSVSAVHSCVQVLRHLALQRYDAYCDNSSCQRFRMSLGTGFIMQTCGRCRLVKYCSRGCQRQAWTAAPVPHRELCPYLMVLRGELHIRGKLQEADHILGMVSSDLNTKQTNSKTLALVDRMHPYLTHVLDQFVFANSSEIARPRFRSEVEWMVATFGTTSACDV